MHSGPLVDPIADSAAIFVLVIVPALLLYVFWMGHILPDKIAGKRGHPRQLNTRFELIGIRNQRLATRIALHLALGGGVTATP